MRPARHLQDVLGVFQVLLELRRTAIAALAVLGGGLAADHLGLVALLYPTNLEGVQRFRVAIHSTRLGDGAPPGESADFFEQPIRAASSSAIANSLCMEDSSCRATRTVHNPTSRNPRRGWCIGGGFIIYAEFAQDAHSPSATHGSATPHPHAETHRHQEDPAHRVRAHHHRPGVRVRLLRHPGVQGTPRGRLLGRPGELQPGDHHDRPGDRRPHLHRADHLAGRREDHRQGEARRAAAHARRADRRSTPRWTSSSTACWRSTASR